MKDDTEVILVIIAVVAIKLAIIFGGAMIARSKDRSAVGWGIACLFFNWIALLIIICLPKVAKTSALSSIVFSATTPAYDATRWAERLKVDANLAAKAAKLRPHGDRYVAYLASAAQAGQGDSNLTELTQELLAKAAVDADASSKAAALDQAALNGATLFEAASGVVVARLQDGRALAKFGSELRLFDTLVDYREWSNDHNAWKEIKKFA